MFNEGSYSYPYEPPQQWRSRPTDLPYTCPRKRPRATAESYNPIASLLASKKAPAFAVANLTPRGNPTASQEHAQFVIAVAGHDISLSLFNTDLQVINQVSLTTKIKRFRTIKSVHPFQITGLAFSNFIPPPHPLTASTPPQYLKLASVSVSNTVVVHTLPLLPVPLSVKHGQSTTMRSVVALPSDALSLGVGVALSVLVLLVAVVVHGALEIRGAVNPVLGAPGTTPSMWQDVIGGLYRFPGGYEHNVGVPAVLDESLIPATKTDADRVLPFLEETKAKEGGRGEDCGHGE